MEKVTKATAGTTAIDHTIQVPAQTYKRSNWPLEIPLIPTFTFDSMDMASNRFSHANAMSVVENVGTTYNPFFIFGESGSGKTHFLHAIGYELSKKIPQEKLFITNGVRLARGIQRYVEEGKAAQLEETFRAAEVLIIDDIHLTAVNEFNREIISKVLNGFVNERKQIIISSKYPPESLARFEELVSFKLEQGWVSELKPPRPQHFTQICNKMVEHSGLNISETQSHSFFSGDNMSLGKIARDIRRVKVLHRRIADSGVVEKSYEELFVEMLAINGENESSEIVKKDITDITTLPRMESAEWGNFGFFFPQDQGDKFNWVAFAIMQKAKELGINGGFHFALKSAYSTENIISSAFKIANICDNKNLKGAIILGPSLTAVPGSIRENFYDIVLHMLEVMLIRCGTIDAELIKHPSAYIKVLGDIIK
jgi:chromosomal replication initiator protein